MHLGIYMNLWVNSGREENIMNPISWIWKMMNSIASYFNTKVFHLSICPTRFISLLGIISLWGVKAQTKGDAGRIRSGI